jgi:hypothetical protein
VDDETDGDELDDEQETEAAASDPNFAGDKQRAVLGEYLPQFWKYQAARKYWTPQRVYEYWMEAREIVREKKKVPEGEEVKASAHIEVSSLGEIFPSFTGTNRHLIVIISCLLFASLLCISTSPQRVRYGRVANVAPAARTSP